MFDPKIYIKIIDDDNKIRRQGKYPISKNGQQILIKTSGGLGQADKKFVPMFSIETELEEVYPRWKFWKKNKKYHLVKPFAERCINFKTEAIPGLSIEEIDNYTGKNILHAIGDEKKDSFLTWLTVAMIGVLLLMQILNSGVL